MRPIVCATRGGEVSRRTQERAIALASERDAELIFLCVVDPRFAKLADESLAVSLADELQRMGESLLSIAQTRAQKQNVVTRTAVLHGSAWQNIEDYVRKVDAGALVIGSPRTGSESVHHLAEEMHKNTGVEVVLVT